MTSIFSTLAVYVPVSLFTYVATLNTKLCFSQMRKNSNATFSIWAGLCILEFENRGRFFEQI